jgi:glutaredoxin
MRSVDIFVGKNCDQCKWLKKFLNEYKVNYQEYEIDNKEVAIRLEKDKKFQNHFCDIEACRVELPIMRLKDTGEFFYKSNLDFDNMWELKKLLQID